MASAVNAQCALSCSLQASQLARPGAAVASFAHAGHACCPDSKSPARNEVPRKKPCPTPAPALFEVKPVDAFQFADNLHFIDLTVSCSLVRGLQVQCRALPISVELSDSYGIPAFSILRV